MAQDQTLEPLARLRAFLLPGGEDAARRVRCVRLKEKGEMRFGPESRWIAFTSEERIDAGQSGFVWEARFRTARVMPTIVVDAYEQGRGRLVAKIGGVRVMESRGPDADRGELQRYLSSVAICPPMLVAHPTLVWTVVYPQMLQLRDSADSSGTTVNYEIGEDGLPICCRADRPRIVGKQAVLTPWSAAGLEFRERDGLRVATHLEAVWHLPEGGFTYFRSQVTSFTVER